MAYLLTFSSIPKDRSNPEYLEQTDIDSPHPATQLDPDSQTAPPQARNSASGCSAVRSLHHNIGFAVGTADARSDRRVHLFSDDPRRRIRRTI